MYQIINNKIQQGFSESAKGYDLLSGLHRGIADKLLAQVIKGPEPAAILDVGCGTGYLTVKVKEYFPQSKITGLDFAQGMLDVARQRHQDIVWVLGEYHQLPFPNGIFDSVISNLAYQWAGDLYQAFSEARRVMRPDGAFACTLFGYNTCQELFQSLAEAQAGQLKFSRLPELSQVREALAINGFKKPNVQSECIKIKFKDMYDLIAWLKSIGANNIPREGYVGREALSLASSIYCKKFGLSQGVGATFEVITVYAKK